MYSKRKHLFILTEMETRIANYFLSHLEEVQSKTSLKKWSKDLDLTYGSFRTHLQHMREKYDVTTTQELISEIVNRGLITEDDIEFKDALLEMENNCNKL